MFTMEAKVASGSISHSDVRTVRESVWEQLSRAHGVAKYTFNDTQSGRQTANRLTQSTSPLNRGGCAITLQIGAGKTDLLTLAELAISQAIQGDSTQHVVEWRTNSRKLADYSCQKSYDKTPVGKLRVYSEEYNMMSIDKCDWPPPPAGLVS